MQDQEYMGVLLFVLLSFRMREKINFTVSPFDLSLRILS